MDASEPLIVIWPTPSASRGARLLRWVGGFSAAVCCMLLVVGWYMVRYGRNPPGPGSPVGLTLDVAGFLLMLCAETLYSLRKRLRRFSYGRLSTWLQTHIFLGSTGALLVLLHGAGKWHGLAGAAMAVLLVVVASGLIGRYVYTAAPRTMDGLEIDAGELLAQFAVAERRWQACGIRLSDRELARLSVSPALAGWAAVLARPGLLWRQRRRVRHLLQSARLAPEAHQSELAQLLLQRYRLQLDLRSMAATRRWLAWWHLFHVPLALVLLTLATVHALVALRYAW